MKLIERIEKKYAEKITNINDLTGGKKPSLLFYFLASKLDYLLENKPELCVSKTGVKMRRKLHPLIKKIGPLFLYNKQVYENKNDLLNENEGNKTFELPETPVIWVANHAFKDDVLATVLAAKRHAYILFGSVPQFYNTTDGLTSYLNGIVMTNRKVSASKKAVVSKAIKAMEYGADLIIFPEGVWNKTPNKPIINLWPGVYKIAQATGAKIVPIVHYTEDMNMENKEAKIHTVIDDPFDINIYQEKEALELLRDKLATLYMLMLEKYSKPISRSKVIGENQTAQEVWEEQLQKRIKTASRYDIEIETKADYRPNNILNPEEVWETISNVKNVNAQNVKDILHAQEQLRLIKENDYQRRF